MRVPIKIIVFMESDVYGYEEFGKFDTFDGPDGAIHQVSVLVESAKYYTQRDKVSRKVGVIVEEEV